MAVYKPITVKQYAPSSERTGGAVVPYSSGAVVPYSPPTRAVSVQPAVQDRGSAGVIGRSFATFGDLVANILTGAAKSLEGIVDLGMTGVGAVGGIFSDEFRDEVRKHVEYDFVGTHIGDPLQELTGESYLNELRIGKYNVGEAVELIAQGVGGMLPSIGLAALTGGGSLAAQIAGTGSMMAGAAGNATEEAFESGASYGSAAAYGLVRGAVEGATEYLGGVTLGGGTSLIGKKLAGTALGEAVQKGAGRLAYTFISEGAEEVLSDLSDPLAKYVTGVDKNIGENYNDVVKGLPKTFLVGGSVGSLMGGAQDFLRSHTKEQAARGGGAATRSDHFLRNVIEISENEGKGADAERFEAAKLSSYQAMSSELVRMSDEHRAKYLDSIGVHKLAFDENGQLVAKVAESVNAEAVSPALRSLSGNLVHAPIGADVQISESAATAKDTVLKAVGKRANVVITDAIKGDNALYNPHEDVIYISNGKFDGSSFNTEDVARAIALHEVAHKAEGTEAFGRMAYELERILKDEKAPEDVKALVGDYRARREGLSKLYTDENQSKAQNEYVVSTELVANMLGDLLGNSYFVERMGARNDGAWKRFVLALKAAHDGKAAGISKEAQKYLSGLYKSYVKAVDASGQGVKVSSMVDEREKEKAPEGSVDERRSKTPGGGSDITLNDVNTLRSIGRKSINKFTSAEIKIAEKWAKKFYKELGIKSPFFRAWFGEWRAHDISPANIVSFAYGESGKLNYKSRKIYNGELRCNIIVDDAVIEDSLHYAKVNGDEKQIRKLLGKVDEILEKGILLDTQISTRTSGHKKGSTQFMHYLYTPISINGAPFVAKMSVEEYDLTSQTRAYNLQRIEMSTLSRAQFSQMIDENRGKYAYNVDALSVAQLYEFVKTFDKDFVAADPVSKEVLNKDGTPKVFYHQTAEEFTMFDPRREGPGTSDNETPFGIFMKPNDSDIGLRGKKQMKLYARIANPLVVSDRRSLVQELKRMSPKYEELLKREQNLATEYKLKLEKASAAYVQYAKEYRITHPDATRAEIYKEEAFRKLFEAEKLLTDEWIEKAKEISVQCKDEITRILKSNEYDGVILKRDEGSQGRVVETYIALDPNQVKSAETGDRANIGTFDKSDPDIRHSKKKVYKRADASATLEEAVKTHLEFTDAYAELKGKTKKEATDILWKALNTAEDEQARRRAALNVADFVLDNAVVEAFGEDPSAEANARTVAILKEYMHKLDLDGIKGEIRNRFGKQNSIHLVWGKREGEVGVAPDSIKNELIEQGIAITASNPADIFFEIYDAYQSAKAGLEDHAKILLKNGLATEERATLREEIARDILRAYEEKGVATVTAAQFYREMASAERRAEFWKKRYYEEIDRNHITNRLLDKVKDLDELKKGAFLSATQSRTEIEKFKGSIFRLSRIRFRGNLNRRGTRRILAALHAWYTDENNTLIKGTPGLYDESIAAALKNLAQNERVHTEAEDAILDGLVTRFKTSDLKKLHELYTVKNLGKEYDANVKLLLRELSSEVIFDTEELRALESVVDYFTHFVKNYNKVWRADKYVDAPELARGYIRKFSERKRKSPGTLRKWFEAYYASYGDPMALVRYMDCYDKHGFFTESLEEIRRAGIEAAVLEMKILEPVEKFYKEKPKFLRDLKKKTVKAWGGAEIPLAKAISLYMTLGRDQAILGLARKGYAFQLAEDSKKMRVEGFAPIAEVTDDQLAAAAKEERDKLYKQFTEDEKTYIGLVEEALQKCKEYKHETDMIRHGYSNTIEGYYFPIARAYISHSIDGVKFGDELDRVSSKSFNKDTVEKAAGELWINDVDAILNRHVRGVSQYAKLSTVIDTFDVLYSLDVSGEGAAKVESIATESSGVWAENEKYFRDLISDVQGIREGKRDTLINKLLPSLRSGYAKYLLGANPKVWVTQLSSLAASTSILDADCLMKGFSIGAKDVDEFCALAQLRNTDNAAALAQGVLENVSGFGDVLMKPIGAVDRFVIGRLFAACQVQVAKNGTAALGTEENKVKAGELLERVILETQQNSLATERSAAMRSENEIDKALTMFSADAMKVIGRVIDAFGEASTLRRMLKLSKDSSEATRLQKELKRAEKRVRRSVGALLSSAVLMALIAQLVRRLLNKKDKDEVVENIVGDVAGNLIGGLPLIRDVATYFMDGYDIDYYAFSAMNDLLKSTSEIFALGQDAIEGDWDSRKTAKAIRNAFYSAGMVLGVPVRNVYNYSYGVINAVSPETGYRMDDLFYSKSYRADLAAAIEKGDEGMVATIAGLMMDNGVGGMTNKALRQTIRDLIAAGYDVVPRSVKSSFTYEEQVFELDSKQKKAFEKTYAQAHEAAAQLVKLKGFASASEAVKAKAIGFVYDLYYDTAIRERVGDGSLGKSALFAKAIDVPVLALTAATAKSLESDKDKAGKTVAGSLKKKVHDYVAAQNLTAAQKYMLMGYLGYKNTLGEDKVKAYIQTLKLTEEQKKTLLEESGY